MTTPSPFKMISAVLRARLRNTPLPPGFKRRVEVSAKQDVAWVRVASRHRIAPALGACISDLDLTDALPPDLALYFQAMADRNGEQNKDFLQELAAICDVLNGEGIEPCLLKGATTLVSELFPDISWRFMNDIDLLLPKAQIKTAWNALRVEGYRAYEGVIDGKEHHHEKPLWHPEKRAYVELHRQTGRPRQRRILPANAILERSRLIDHPQIGRVRLPHRDDLATMLIAHAQIFDNYARYGTFRLIDLVEMDALTTCHVVDVASIAERFRQFGWSRQCLAFYHLADRLLGTPALNAWPVTSGAALAARRMVWLQGCRSALMASIIVGWTLRTVERCLLDGDWRLIRPRMVQSIAGNKRAPFFSLMATLRDLS